MKAVVILFACIAGNTVGTENYFVANGKDAEPYQFPFIVPIYVYNPRTRGIYYICTGTLLTPKHVLTAAHCLLRDFREVFCKPDHWTSYRTQNIMIRMHDPNSTEPSSSLVDRTVNFFAKNTTVFVVPVEDPESGIELKIEHERSERNTEILVEHEIELALNSGDNETNTTAKLNCVRLRDLGIIELEHPVPLDVVGNFSFRMSGQTFEDEVPKVETVTLVKTDQQLYVGESHAAGWGFAEDNREQLSTWLQTSMVDDVNLDLCAKMWEAKNNRIRGVGIFCTEASKGIDTCGGDSGSPLMKKIEGKMEQIGVLSFGHNSRCGDVNDTHPPAVYTDLRYPQYKKWLAEKTGQKHIE